MRVAEALRVEAAQALPDAEAIHLDALEFVTPRLRRIYSQFYLSLVQRAPSLWSHVYRMTNEARPGGWTNRIRRRVERRDCQKLVDEIARIEPELIICTHFLPAEILSQQIGAGELSCPVWVQVTDYDLHRMWVHPHIDGYFATNSEVAFRMREQGIAPGTIHVTGMPIMPAFSRKPERAGCARELGLDPGVTTFLLMGGGAGIGGLSATARRVLDLPGKFQLIALAGKNEAELAKLQALAAAHPGKLAPQGYTNKVERLMACADLVITKPGGVTTAECLAMGLPMIVMSPIPGQEDRNANYVLEHGAALRAFDLPSLEYRLRYLMAHPGKLDAMRSRAQMLGRVDAAGRVIKTVLKKVEIHA
ncbi:glycosyltransferase [Massilia terrae]|uniref:Galactosyldiacylglycerol synthase n=1 Tax=Massilia terrae TaxID=1811224 RepID=A0ABT2D0T9_9BURK|nr:glycosyltransferase [Massilia terrae]MCS0659650.1 galactosyldiacylglycerol synthase [Massilia terrae]